MYFSFFVPLASEYATSLSKSLGTTTPASKPIPLDDNDLIDIRSNYVRELATDRLVNAPPKLGF